MPPSEILKFRDFLLQSKTPGGHGLKVYQLCSAAQYGGEVVTAHNPLDPRLLTCTCFDSQKVEGLLLIPPQLVAWQPLVSPGHSLSWAICMGYICQTSSCFGPCLRAVFASKHQE